MNGPDELIAFWCDAGAAKWFARDVAFDAEIRRRFEPAHHAAARGELDAWAATAQGALALILLLDQVPRNCFRDSAHAFATDPLARQRAARAIDRGDDQQVAESLRQFFLLPFEHAEDLVDQERSVELARTLGGEPLEYALAHREVIRQFGRFPHRNRALGRANTPAEQDWLDAGGGF